MAKFHSGTSRSSSGRRDIQSEFSPSCSRCSMCHTRTATGMANASCASSVAGLWLNSFVTKDDMLMCIECYSNEYSAKCHVCLKTIMPGSKKMEYEGNSWSFVQKDGNNYYMPCCEKQFSLQCVHCKPITTGGVNYCDQPWHKEWLVCTGCKYQLADQWLTSWDDFAFCLNCSCNLFAKKCHSCSSLLFSFQVAVEGEYISFEQWRSKCFNCKRCCVSLVGQGFLTCKDNILCTDCGKDF
uniref:LIM zinc-binding domain-containing protein n=1 Tax=Monopterus albus TaxID=43700 RepID=A0A3Q3KCH3_MONAL